MKLKVLVLILLLITPIHVHAADKDQKLTNEQKKYINWARGIWNSLDRQKGKIELPNGKATLNLPDDFYYLNPKDADKILVDVWQNPPGRSTLGMIMPEDITPFESASWGVTIEYSEDGYIKDDNAATINYDEMLKKMKESVKEESREREKKGYSSIELIGWAAKPYYDRETHKLYWAKEFKFGNDPENTLNYNIRVLGRKGVLVLNFISSMKSKNLIESKIDKVLASADFNQGSRYSDFNPKIDKVAAYGIGALIAGKLIAKTGLFAAALLFLKKFGILALIFLKKFGIFIVAGIAAFFKKIFSRNKG